MTTTTKTIESLKITNVTERDCGGRWINGTVDGYRFQALAFNSHESYIECELADSRISKLWLQRADDRAVVANYDRGWDVLPTTPDAERIVDVLVAGLAESVDTL